MAGSDVPYHLRPNKFVERQLFFELLRFVDKFKDLKTYSYISMGGKFLEDSRQIHAIFGVRNLVSIDIDEEVVARQKFNTPIGTMCFHHMSAAELVQEIDTFRDNEPINTICWLDYADAGKRYTQLCELQTLVKRAVINDVVKITLNANIATLGECKDLSVENRRLKRYEKLKLQLSNHLPETEEFGFDAFSAESFPKFLIAAIRNALKSGLQGRDLVAFPLCAISYCDQHTMLTLTAIILPIGEENQFKEKSGILDWPYLFEENQLTRITVPDLSLKERITIDSMAYKYEPTEIQTKLGFLIGNTTEESIEAIQNYLEHLRRYPSFHRISF